MNIFSKVFGTRSEHEVKRIMPLVEKTESLRTEMQKLTDEQLRDKTREFRKRLDEGETLDDLLPEAFAVVREGAKRVLGMEHYRDTHFFALNLIYYSLLHNFTIQFMVGIVANISDYKGVL